MISHLLQLNINIKQVGCVLCRANVCILLISVILVFCYFVLQTLTLAGMSSEVMITATRRRLLVLPLYLFNSPNSALVTTFDVSSPFY